MTLNFNKLFVSILLLYFLVPVTSLQAQRKPGNEWISYGQDYYKLKLKQDGFYRVNHDDLAAAGVDIDNQDVSKMQLFYRGKEVPLYVEMNGSQLDHFEFFGRRNDGAMDSVMYDNPSQQTHKDYSTYTDTATYFLTWSSTNQGARMDVHPANLNAGYAAKDYFMDVSASYLHEIYDNGKPIIAQYNFIGSDYNDGEGWMSKYIAFNTSNNTAGSRVISLAAAAIQKGAAPASLEFGVYGKSDVLNVNPDHHLIVDIQQPDKTYRVLLDTIFSGFQTIRKIYQLNDNDYSTTTSVRFRSMGVNNNSDVITVAYVKLNYPASFTANSLSAKLFSFQNPSSDSVTHFKYTGTLSSHPVLSLYDITHGVRMNGVYTNDSLHFTMPNFGGRTDYYLYNPSAITALKQISKADMTPIDLNTDYNYLIITNHFLNPGAQAFASYKASQMLDSVTPFKPYIVYTDQLYDQFFYGLHHVAALQNFLAYYFNNATTKPQYLLLLGKGWEPDLARNNYGTDYVPVAGMPPTDLMLTSGIDNNFAGHDTTLAAIVPTGRIPALRNEDIMNYLGKVEENDASGEPLWKKDNILVSGGNTETEQTQNRNFLKSMGDLYAYPYTGGRPRLYAADKSNTVYKDIRQAIQNNMESGAGMLTYLAHGSLNVLGVDIADTNRLSNKGRYPIMFLNGCNVGNFAYSTTSLGEWYIFKKDKGAINWLSHSNTTLDVVLYAQIRAMYNNMTVKSYGGSIGNLWAHTIDDMQPYYKLDEYRSLVYEWTLMGDPSTPLPFLDKPDYAVSDSSLFVTPSDVLSTADSLQLAIPVTNYGKADYSGLCVSVTQKTPNGTVYNLDTLYLPSVFYKDTIYYTIKIPGKKMQGLNHFDVYLDPCNQTDETNENNNHASLDYFLSGAGARILFPSDFGIAGTDTPELMVQSRDLTDKSTGVYMEIDTTPNFNSPIHMSSPALSGSNIIRWRPKLPLRNGSEPLDSTVYYWRTRLNLPADSGGDWEVHSFTYIKGSPPGWSQSHFPQYNGVETNGIIVDSVNRLFSFLPVFKYYTLTSSPWSTSNLGIKPDGDLGILASVRNSSTVVFVQIDKQTLKLVDDPTDSSYYTTFCFGSQCVPYDFMYLQFNMSDSAERARFVKYVNKVKPGNYVLLVNRNAKQYRNLYDQATLDAFKKIGGQMIQTLKRDTTMYVLAGIKGDSIGTTLAEDTTFDGDGHYSGNQSELAYARVGLQGAGNSSGTITSRLIGPAVRWKAVHHLYRNMEPQDSAFLQVYAVTKDGQDSLVIDSLMNRDDSLHIDASRYPYLRLTTTLTDRVNLTSPQLKMWQVIYDGAPEGTLDLDSGLTFDKDTLKQGDSLHVRLKFRNISPYPMQRLLVNFSILDDHNSEKLDSASANAYYPALDSGQYVYIDRKFSTRGMAGLNKFQISVNPNFEQPEMTLDNNIFKRNFFVQTDAANPVMDVTFDGRHLVNGEIIRPTPEIIVSARDENTTLLLNDTSSFLIQLTRPDKAAPDTLRFSSPEVSFRPSDSGGKSATVVYRPAALPSGVYNFSAQVRDRSGNPSGNKPYNITFRIIRQPSASNFYMYPNPLTSWARFVYVLTGDTIPDVMAIRIFDMCGRQVDYIGPDKMGKPRIGQNSFTWNGTGSDGNPLANGIYFYKVILLYNGQELPRYSLPNDSVFDKDYGKIMILREP
jgi:hypothetical protein